MLSRLRAVRLVAVTALFVPVGWLAQAGPAALAGTGTGTGTGAGTSTAAGRPGGLAAPAAVRAVARQPAPLVADSGAARRKRGLPAPPMTAAMLRADAVKQSVTRAFLQAKSSHAGPGGKCASRACRRGCRPRGP